MDKINGFSFETMVNAARSCDASFDGKFWLGVRTTQIYCLPSCKARFPLEKNIVFFSTRKEAKEHGFHGCKRCKSDFYPFVAPDWLEKIKKHMRSNLNRKIEESELVSIAEVDITTIRRYFKDYQKISLLAYHRKLRMNQAKKLLEEGNDIKEVCQMVGYQSMGGFVNAYKKEFNILPEA